MKRFQIIDFYSHVWILVLMLGSISSCQTIKMASFKKSIDRQIYQSPDFTDHFTGFALYDPETSEYIYRHQIDKHFTPASNTKLFTFYAGLALLEDSIPALRYIISGDSLIFWGTGDPTFLHERFPYQPVFQFLKDSPFDLYLATGNYHDEKYGPGWSWDDYNDAYQVERSAFPIYGNVVRFSANGNDMPEVVPSVFGDAMIGGDGYNSRPITRSPASNIFYVNRPDQRKIPFITYPELVGQMLMDTLGRKIRLVDFKPRRGDQVLYSQSANLVYQWMLQPSDNFLAEQLLVVYGSTLGDELSGEDVIRHVKSRHLHNLTDEAVWMDGSGLSRYNLFTPRTMVELLIKIKDELPYEELFPLLPAGGESGTLKNWYQGDTGPYVFAKTGTLRNNHSVSGYLRTNSGKILIFSFMNNNYTNGSTPVKKAMQQVFELIRDSY